MLAVEDNPADALLVREMLREHRPSPHLRIADRLATGIDELVREPADLVLLDLSLPDADGLDALEKVRSAALDVPVVVLSGRDDERLAVRAVAEGAQDYLIKGQVDARLLARSISYAIERKRAEVQLAHQALHDALTGLPNRALFLDRLTQALARLGRAKDESVGVLFLDLDRFKVVNDSLGHDAGDRLLVEVARRLDAVLRPGDTAARFGGDEFTVLCEGTDAREAVVVAERIASVLEQPVALEGGEAFVRASIGIAVARHGARDDPSPEALVRDADAAMYRAKSRGGAGFELFDDAMRASAIERLEVESALHRALERREFHVVYQPQVDLADGRVCAAEALVRWRHPQRGVVAPGDFIESAEETGIIVPLGAWVLEEACRAACRWDVPVSVNLSARQCAHPELVESVAAVLERAGCPPDRLLLEITETAVMADMEQSADVLERLKALGVRLAIDDFGTGWSSLKALRLFPVDEVKIDGSFVAGLEDGGGDGAIVEAVVSLGRALGLRTVAECVETEGQAARLRSIGCDVAQGFLFARPVEAREVERLLAG